MDEHLEACIHCRKFRESENVKTEIKNDFVNSLEKTLPVFQMYICTENYCDTRLGAHYTLGIVTCI